MNEEILLYNEYREGGGFFLDHFKPFHSEKG